MRLRGARSLAFSVGFLWTGCAPEIPWGASPQDAAPPATPILGIRPDAAVASAPDAGPARPGLGTPTSARPGAPDGEVDASALDAASEPVMRAPAGRAPRVGDVVIDELLVDPAGNDLGHEWIELANAAGEALDLGGVHISDGTTDVAVAVDALAPGARLVLGQSTDRAHNGDAPVDVAYGTRLQLNNAGDRVAVCVGACAGGLELDAFAWAAPFGEAYVGHAVVVERAPTTATMSMTTTTTCPAATPYGDAGNFGTPGAPNPPCPIDAGSDGDAELQSAPHDHGDAAGLD